MVGIFTRRLVLAEDPPLNQDVILYTVPPAAQVVVRDIVLAAAPPSPGFVLISIRDPGGSLVPVVWQVTAAGTNVIHLELRQALQPGDELIGYFAVAVTGVAITGYVFEP